MQYLPTLLNFWGDPNINTEPPQQESPPANPIVNQNPESQIEMNEKLTSEYFFKIIQEGSENTLLCFLNEFIYADPHLHFQGTPTPHQWKEIASESKLHYDPKTLMVIKKSVTSKPCFDLLIGGSISKEFEKTVMITDNLFSQQSHMYYDSKCNIPRMMEMISPKLLIGPFFREMKAQNINYAEPIIEVESLLNGLSLPQKYLNLILSFDTSAGCTKSEEEAESVLSENDYFDKFIRRFEDFFDECEIIAKKILGTEKSVFSKEAPLQVKFKGGLLRIVNTGDIPDPSLNQKILFAELLALTKLIQKHPNKICSIDLIGPEDWNESESYLFPQLQILHYLTNKSKKSKKEEEQAPTKNHIRSVSIHVGELTEASGVPRSVLNTRVSKVFHALKSAVSLSLSHLNSWIYDVEKHGLIDYIKQKNKTDHKISLVTLPCSDEKFLRQTTANHISQFFIDQQLMDYVLVGSDMPGPTCRGISQQYLFLIKASPHYFDYYRLKDLMINAYERTHLEGEGIYYRDHEGHYRIKDSFKTCLLQPYDKPYEARGLLEISEKAQREWQHLQSIYKIEKIYSNSMRKQKKTTSSEH